MFCVPTSIFGTRKFPSRMIGVAIGRPGGALTSGVEQLVARVTHNHKVGSSNLLPATPFLNAFQAEKPVRQPAFCIKSLFLFFVIKNDIFRSIINPMFNQPNKT